MKKKEKNPLINVVSVEKQINHLDMSLACEAVFAS